MVYIEKLFPEEGYGFTNEGFYFKVKDLKRAKGEVPCIGCSIHKPEIIWESGITVRIGGELPNFHKRKNAHEWAKANHYKAIDVNSETMYKHTMILAALARVPKNVTSSGIEFLVPNGFYIQKLTRETMQWLTEHVSNPSVFVYKNQIICKRSEL